MVFKEMWRQGKERYFGWMMVVISLIVQGIGIANQFMAGLFIQPFMDKFGASSASVLICTSGIMILMAGLASPICGVIVQRFSTKKLMLVAMSSVALGYFSLAYATELWQVAAIHALLFSTGALVGSLAGATLISNWFVSGRGKAFGVASAGVALAGALWPPVVANLLTEKGLSFTFVALSCSVLVVLPLIWVIAVDSPAELGMHSDNEDLNLDEVRSNEVDTKVMGLTLAVLIRSRLFWIVAIIGGGGSAIAGVISVNLVMIAQKSGIDGETSSYLISAVAIGTMVGTIIFGGLFDLLGQRRYVQWAAAISMIPCVILSLDFGFYQILVASIALGLGLGAFTLAPNILVSANFSRHDFSLVLGVVSSVFVGFYLATLPMFGLANDLTGSFEIVLIICLVVFSLLAVVACGLPSTKEYSKLLCDDESSRIPGLPDDWEKTNRY